MQTSTTPSVRGLNQSSQAPRSLAPNVMTFRTENVYDFFQKKGRNQIDIILVS